MAKTKKPTRKKPPAKNKAKKTAKKKPAVKLIKPIKKIKTAQKSIRKPAVKTVRVKKRAPGVPEQLRDAALKVLDERQADDIFTIDLAGKSSMTDYLIIASARATRQIAAIAHYLREAFIKGGAGPIRVEGLPEANWVLVDAGDVVVHLFRPDVRKYYNLESLWKG